MTIKYLAVTSLMIFLSVPAFCLVKLPQLLRDSMVLQRDATVKIWGWASAEEKIKINFQNKKYSTTADKNGNWNVRGIVPFYCFSQTLVLRSLWPVACQCPLVCR